MIYKIEIIVGYMLKVLKNNKNLKKFKKEFNSIKHGNYDEFRTLIGGEQPSMVVYDFETGESKTNNFSQKNGDCDFVNLTASGPSLDIFYEKCKNVYGDIKDTDISDEIYRKLALFEIELRMHATNNRIKEWNLEDVIKKLCYLKNISPEDEEKLHNGRKFLNEVKHPKHKNYDWKKGISDFDEACELVKIKGLNIK
jgi:hypothetical protein